MVPEPASHVRIKLASLLVGRPESGEEGTELFEAMFSIDESDGETICEFEINPADLEMVSALFNCDTHPAERGMVFVVVGFGDTPIQRAVAQFMEAFKDVTMGLPRFVFELLQGDGKTSSGILLSVLLGSSSLFTISEWTSPERPRTVREQWWWYFDTIKASDLVDTIEAEKTTATVRLTAEGTMYSFESITRLVSLFPRGGR